MKSNFDDLNQSFLDLYNKKGGLPEWRKILYAFDIAEREPTHANIKYVNLMYHAIKDLFSREYSYWMMYTDIDEEKKTVTFKRYKNYENKLGREESEPDTYSPDTHRPDSFKYFEGKSLEELNKGKKIYEVCKLEALYLENITNDIETYFHHKEISKIAEEIDEKFDTIRESNILKCTFEGFIEEIKQQANTKSDVENPGTKNKNSFSAEIALTALYYLHEQTGAAPNETDYVKISKILLDDYGLDYSPGTLKNKNKDAMSNMQFDHKKTDSDKMNSIVECLKSFNVPKYADGYKGKYISKLTKT